MKKFLIRLLLIALPPCLLIMLSLFCWMNGFVDPHYLKFASPKQSSMILGTSRSSLGLCPEVFKENGFAEMYNYSFTIVESPWGEDYFESITRKLDTTRKNGTFILTVDMFSLSCNLDEYGNEILPHTMLNRINNVSQNPNWEYIFKMKVMPWRYFLYVLHLYEPTFELHEDGWYENKRIWDAEVEKQETQLKLAEYAGFSKSVLSKTRFLYLEKTIELLQKYGMVYLVRLPTSEAMYALEETMSPNFDEKIFAIAEQYKVKYINLAGKQSYRTFDGNHIIPEDAKILTQVLCDSIRQVGK